VTFGHITPDGRGSSYFPGQNNHTITVCSHKLFLQYVHEFNFQLNFEVNHDVELT